MAEPLPRSPGPEPEVLPRLGLLLSAMEDALSDPAIERAAALGGEWLALLGAPEVRRFARAMLPLLPHLSRAAEHLRPMVEAGLLDRLLELLGVGVAALDALTPLQVERLAAEAEGLVTLLTNVMTEDPAVVWRASLQRVLSTWEDPQAAARPVGLGDLLRLRRDPQVQRVLRALLALAHSPEKGPP
jgi:uncharacterized protein YjgD (DUF1641 family)